MYDKTVRRRRAVLALLVGCSLILLTAYFGESTGGGLHSLQRGVFSMVSPIQDVSSRALKPFRDLFGWVGDTFDAKGENKKLRRELDEARLNRAQYEAAIEENAQLRDQLSMDTTLGLKDMGPVNARVSGTSPTVFQQTITINKGSSDGLRIDQPVVNGDGLVGKVTDVVGGSAVVTLITDPDFAASAKVSGRPVTGVVEPAAGNPRDLVMRFTTHNDRVDRGDTIVTRGTDAHAPADIRGLFPPDVPIGRVWKIDDPGTDAQLIHLRPFVDVRSLDHVQILTRSRIA